MAAPNGDLPPLLGRREPIDVVLMPFRRFLRYEAAGGVLLLIATVIALIWANSPYADSYTNLWHHTKFTIGLGDWTMSKDLVHWINDLLMAVFFLVVGLEIKHEVLVGELASPRRAAVPIFAAIGGMAVPGAIYAACTWNTPELRGWGVPMATDIAFALGVLAILGRRIPLTLRIFLASLAIIDDLGALLVIAIFYTEEIDRIYLMIAMSLVAVLAAHNALGVRKAHPYALIGLGVWYALYKSGVHSTIAGVLVAMTIPARSRVNAAEFLTGARQMLGYFERSGNHDESAVLNSDQQVAVQTIEVYCDHIEAPLHRIEHHLLPWVSFAIVPVFALANAGVSLTSGSAQPTAAATMTGVGEVVEFTETMTPLVGGGVGGVGGAGLTIGIALGLILGKPIGIMLLAYLAVRSGIGALPADVTWRQVFGASCLAGIGFTMSLFIAQLAFPSPDTLATAKVAILGASLVAGIVGFIILRTGPASPPGTVTDL